MKKNAVILFLLMNVFTLPFFVVAQEAISVTAGHVRETIPGTDVSAAYMTISNKSEQSIKLIAAKSRLSNRIEIHQHLMVDGMMKMRKQDFLQINANSTATLQPSGYHLMIFDVQAPLTDGETLAITLYFDNKQEVTVSLPIQGLKQKHSHHHH